MIGGNARATIQIKTTAKNSIGEAELTWVDKQTLTGWLDFMSGEAKTTTYNSKIEESSHVFVADYQELDASIKKDNSRMVVDGGLYEIKYIDDPMGLHRQLEIFLAYTGGQ